MTNQELVAHQRRARDLHELAKTMPDRLRRAASGNSSLAPSEMSDAAELIDFLNERIRRAANDAREAERDSRDAYREGRADGQAEHSERWF